MFIITNHAIIQPIYFVLCDAAAITMCMYSTGESSIKVVPLLKYILEMKYEVSYFGVCDYWIVILGMYVIPLPNVSTRIKIEIRKA